MSDLTSLNANDLLRQAHINKAREATHAEMAAKAKNEDKIDKAAKEFEAMFLSEMLKPMFEGVMDPDPMFGGGKGEEIFGGMMVQEYSKTITDRGGIGIAKMVKAEMLRIQEASNGDR